MNRLRFSDVKSTIARVMNTCDTNAKVLTMVNEAHQRLVQKGKWVGTVQAYRICVGSDSCLVWPRQIETIEAWALCSDPGQVRNKWYEFSGQGPGIIKDTQNWFRTLIDKGTCCAFDEITNASTVSKIRVTADVTESASARILLQGYNENAAWIRTLDGATWVEGEYVTISTVTQTTTNKFSVLTGVQKPITNGPVRLAEYNTSTGLVTKQLAYYESDETTPIYRKSFIPGMQNMSGCGDSTDSSCTSKTVTVMAKLRHIDVRGDNDWLLLGNLGALKLMVQAILKEDRNLIDEAKAYESAAVKELQDELSSYEGDGAIPLLKTEDRETWGAGVIGPVESNYWFW